MTNDWLARTADALAKLEDAKIKLAVVETELARCKRTLSIIAHDGRELSTEKVMQQRDHFIKIAHKTLYGDDQ